MKRTLPTWMALAACIALACGALAWLSVTTMRLERAEAQARADALVEERVRLALWRMDGRLARLLAQESTRPVSAWEPFYVPAHAFDQSGQTRSPSTTRIASALLYGPPEDVRLHFAFSGNSPLRSPQVPPPEQRSLAFSAGATPEQLTRYGALLAELDARLERQVLLALEPGTPSPELVVAVRQVPQPVAQMQQQNVIEYSRRQLQAFGNAAAPLQEEVPVLTADAREVQVSPVAPVWMGDELLLVRQISRGLEEVEVQGAWLDWPRVRAVLLEEVKDLLPGASLEEGGAWRGGSPGAPAGLAPGAARAWTC